MLMKWDWRSSERLCPRFFCISSLRFVHLCSFSPVPGAFFGRAELPLSAFYFSYFLRVTFLCRAGSLLFRVPAGPATLLSLSYWLFALPLAPRHTSPPFAQNHLLAGLRKENGKTRLA